MRQKFNLNDRIHFELTPEGVKKWEELAQAEKARYRMPDRYTRKTPYGPTATSMWDFMNFFGEALTLGSPVYLVDGCFELEKS